MEGGTAVQFFTLASSASVKAGVWGPSGATGTVGGGCHGGTGNDAFGGEGDSGARETFESEEWFGCSASVEPLSHPHRRRTGSKTMKYLFFTNTTF